ncbi:hypothetical protein EK21DRAFT_93858 [Setomelanomma holmii]|uniref:Uncharacterized protein n=1 Tax=Setomelanomma holmii TaxID=210430 RepID=A0A9P4LFQ8_9PLEO|nr:hypothetical protein EK21DRAFT_93858 [Setomelanomma holmii]
MTPAAGKKTSGHNFEAGTEATCNCQEIQQLQVLVQECQHQLGLAQEQISHLEDECATLRSSTRNIQEHAFQHFESPDWKPDCMDDVRYKLKALESSIKEWAKINSVDYVRETWGNLSTTAINQVLEALKEITIIASERELIAILANDKTWVLVQAFLAHKIHFDIFEHPFFGLDDERREPGNSVESSQSTTRDLPQAMHNMCDEFYACMLS